MARIKRGIYGPSQSSPSTALSSKSAMGSLAESAVLQANACTSWMSGSPESIGNEDRSTDARLHREVPHD